MKYIQFTYVDQLTNISVAEQPASNGPKFPEIQGLEFVWAKESEYPTHVPKFYGTCSNSADLTVPGFTRELTQEEFEAERKTEMRTRFPVPSAVTMRQGRLALLDAALLESVETAMNSIPDPSAKQRAKIEWEYAATIERDSEWVGNLAVALGLNSEQLDELFIAAAKL